MDVALEPSLEAPHTGTHAPERAPALRALAFALTAGAITQALFWRTGFGLNYFLWDLLVLAANVVAFQRGPVARMAPTAWGALTASLLLAFSVVRFESDWVLAVAVLPNLAILAALPLLLRDAPTLAELAALPTRLLGSIVRIPDAVVEVAQTPGHAAGGNARAGLRAVVRGTAIGLPTAGFFALLLSSDPDFAALLGRMHAVLGDAAVFVVLTLVTSVSYLFTHALHRARPARLPWATDLSALGPYRTRDLRDEPLAAPTSRVAVGTWGIVIGQVAAVFALFVVANLRQLFGGATLIRDTSGVTYASYLHAGFGQLLVAATLSVCLVLAGHALVRPRGAVVESDAPVPGGALLKSLEAALLVLTGITLASCVQRLAIYETAYGASHLRLGVAFVELAIFGVLALTLAKVVFRGWRGHGGALVTFATALAVFASGINTDAYVARRNLDRASAGHGLDVDYLRTLSRDASGVLAHPAVTTNASLASALREAYCAPPVNRDLRALRGLSRCAAPAEVAQ